MYIHEKKLISRFHVPQSQFAGKGSRLVRNLELLMPTMDFPGGSVVKNLPAMQDNWVQALGQEDPLEEGMVTHSSILAMDGGAWQATVHGVSKSQTLLKQQ